jgi:arabinose-5-phosphate isomerase
MSGSSWVEEGRRVLLQEAAALQAAAARLDGRFDRAVELILACEGRVIVAGMGKSGLVGRKLAATLASLGTPTAVVHPADALHGDLGMIRPQDLVLLLSNSGETDELLRLFWYLEQQGNRTLLISGSAESTLGRRCSAVLDSGVAEEACPYGLAPTSSALVAMALGDGLAVALATARGFRSEDFARLHPAGSLGQLLLQQVIERMQPLPLPCCGPSTPLSELICVISSGQLGAVFVLEGERLVGVVTDGDLRRHVERCASLNGDAASLMTHQPVSIGPDASLHAAKTLMLERRIGVLAVLEGETLVGALQLRMCG